MAKSNIVGDGTSWPATIERCQDNVGDDTTTFWNNTGVPLINRTAYFKSGNPVFEGNPTVQGDFEVQGTATLASCDVTAQITAASAAIGTTLDVGGDITAGTSGGGGSYKLQSRSVTRSALAIFVNATTGNPAVGAVTVAASENAYQALDLPHGATLTKVSIAVNPSNASPPAGTKVVGSIVKRNITTGATTTVAGPTTDPTTGANYGLHHTFDVTPGATETVDRTTYTYVVQLDGETGGGAANVSWAGTTWTATVTGIDSGVA